MKKLFVVLLLLALWLQPASQAAPKPDREAAALLPPPAVHRLDPGASAAPGVQSQTLATLQSVDYASDIQLHQFKSSVGFTRDFFQLTTSGKTLTLSGKVLQNKTGYLFLVYGNDQTERLYGDIDPVSHAYTGTLDLSGLPAGSYQFDLCYQAVEDSSYWSVRWGVPLVVTAGDIYIPGSQTNRINADAMAALAGRDKSRYANAADLDLTSAQLAAIRSKAQDITKSAASDYDKVLLIHDWVADNIYYNYDGLDSGDYGDNSPYGVFISRIAVCQGYAELTEAMLRSIGIPAVTLAGRAIYMFSQWWDTVDASAANHAWNAAYAQGRWMLLDTTWDSNNSYAGGQKTHEGISGYTYFDPSPESFALDHRILYLPGYECTVTFNAQSGSPVASVKVWSGSQIVQPARPARSGYAFGGWYREAACKTAWNFGTDRVQCDMTLYAKWSPLASFAITAKANNTAYGAVTGGGQYTQNTTATLKATPKAGYRFVRWLEGSTAVSASCQYAFTVTRARTLTAEFAKIGVPGSLKAASAGYSSVKLSWAAVAGAAKYEVYRAASSAGTYTKLTETTSASYTSTGLATGKTYYYKVRAKCVAGSTVTYGGYSAIVPARPVPATPASVKAVSAGYSSVKITWAAVAGATKYEVYRALSSAGTYTKLSETTSASYTSTGLVAGKTYYYKMKAYRLAGSTRVYGGYSATVLAKPVPAAPTGLKAARASSTGIKVSWNTVSGASGYEVYRATTSGGTYTFMKAVTKLSWTNTGLITGKTYYYKVKAYRVVGGKKVYGGCSAAVYAKP